MNKKTIIIGLLLNTWIISSYSYWNFFSSLWWQPKKSVTVLVYIAGDNDLHSFIEDDLQEMQQVGSTNNLNLLVYLNSNFPGHEKMSQKLVIYKNYLEQYGTNKEKDSGDPATLVSACKWAIKHFPSEHFILVLWNHGSGSLNRTVHRSVCYDDTTGNYLTDFKLKEALEKIVALYGKKLDIIAFDACLMADIEIAYALKNYAHYMVASQETIPGTGYGYDHALTNIASRRMHPYQMVKLMVHAFEKEYLGTTEDYTLSGVNLDKVGILTQTTNRIAQSLKTILEKDTTKHCYNVLRSCLIHSTRFDKKYIDMFHLFSALQEKLPEFCLDNIEMENLNDLLEDGLDAITKSVIDYVHGKSYPLCHGISIYWDRKKIDDSYKSTLWAQETQWLSLLETYQAVKNNL